jgi:hypothetical protein
MNTGIPKNKIFLTAILLHVIVGIFVFGGLEEEKVIALPEVLPEIQNLENLNSSKTVVEFESSLAYFNSVWNDTVDFQQLISFS